MDYKPLAITKFKNALVAVLLLNLLLMSGCASVGVKDVDPNHSHDGAWLAEIEQTPKYQKAGGWHMQCHDMSGEFGFIVENSVLQFNFLGKNHETYVAKNGKFRLDVESDYVAKESHSSDVELVNGEITYSFKGRLSPDRAKGTVVVSIAGLGDRGCRSAMVFSKMNTAGT